MNFKILYEVAMALYGALLWFLAPFLTKVRKMLIGRTLTISRIRKFRSEQGQVRLIWFHAASVGEFEQALPIIRLWKEKHPDFRIAVSFYSPSGFELRSKHPLIDVSFYLLADRPWNTAKLIRELKPEALVLIKYEFWFNLLNTCRRLSVPVISVCCILKNNALRDGLYAQVLSRCLPLVDWFFVQNSSTAQVLKEAQLENLTVNGDTRVDRVLEVKEVESEIPWLEEWKGNHKLLIVGSAWAEDLIYLREFLRHAVVEAHGLWRVLIAPHEIDEKHVRHLVSVLQLPCEFYTSWKDNKPETDILILNTLGVLSRAYRYADAAWVGGAFKTGLHNTLEAAVYGIPVGFGPKFEKFQEAKDLIRLGIAQSFPGPQTVWEFFQAGTEVEKQRDRIRDEAAFYFNSQRGASEGIVSYLEQRLLPEVSPEN